MGWSPLTPILYIMYSMVLGAQLIWTMLVVQCVLRTCTQGAQIWDLRFWNSMLLIFILGRCFLTTTFRSEHCCVGIEGYYGILCMTVPQVVMSSVVFWTSPSPTPCWTPCHSQATTFHKWKQQLETQTKYLSSNSILTLPWTIFLWLPSCVLAKHSWKV